MRNYSLTAGIQTFKLCTDSESYMVKRASGTQGNRTECNQIQQRIETNKVSTKDPAKKFKNVRQVRIVISIYHDQEARNLDPSRRTQVE